MCEWNPSWHMNEIRRLVWYINRYPIFMYVDNPLVSNLQHENWGEKK